MTDEFETKQFTILVERAAINGYPPSVDYVDARNPRMIGHTSVINAPSPNYTYSISELRPTIALLRSRYPDAHIEAHEVAHIDRRAMIDRWSKAQEGKRK
jgi:hypothetical protein